MRNRRLFLLSLCAGTFLNPFNSSIIAVSLVSFRDAFDLSVSEVTWVVTAFYVASASVQPILGRLTDTQGPRRLFLWGMAVIVLGSVLAVAATSWATVVVARVIIACGTSAAFPATIKLIECHAPPEARTAMLAKVQMAANIGVSVGPVVGGALLMLSGWRATFLVSVPIAAAAAGLVLICVDPDGPRLDRRPWARHLADLDLVGVFLQAAVLLAVILLVLGPGEVPRAAWGAAAVAAIVGLALNSRRHPNPALDTRTLTANPALRRMFPAWLLSCVVYYVGMYGLPQTLQDLGNVPPGTVGLVMVPMALLSALVTPVVIWSFARWGADRVALAGGALNLLACVACAAVLVDPGPALGVAAACGIGLANGVITLALGQRVFQAAPGGHLGSAMGLFQGLRYVGAILGSCVLGLAFDARASSAGWAASTAVAGVAGAAALVFVARGNRPRGGVGGRE
jgi:MFS family permease